MLSPTADKALTPKTARAEAKEPLCLVDLPHSLLVLVLRWVEAHTNPGKKLEVESVSWLIATFLGCESMNSALRSAVQDDAVWLGLSRRCGLTPNGNPRVRPPAPQFLKVDDVQDDCYTPGESGYASRREGVLAACCLRAIRIEQDEGRGLMAPGGGSFWAAVGMALWTRNPISAVGIVLTHKTACALGQMLEDDLLRHMEQAHLLAIHRTPTTLFTTYSRRITVVNKADLNMLALVNSMQPGVRTQHGWSGPTPFREGGARPAGHGTVYKPLELHPFDTPLLAELCPEEFGLATQAAMIQRCARRAGIIKYTGAFAEVIWARLLQRTASVLQRCAVAMTTNLPHETAVWSVESAEHHQPDVAPSKHYQPIVAPPPRATRFQANNPFGLVEDDNSEEDDEDDEGEGEELTETEDEDESWRVQARAHMPATHVETLRCASCSAALYARVVTGAATEGDQSGRGTRFVERELRRI